MKSVVPLDVHRLREFYTAKNEGAVNVQTQPVEAEDTDSNEIDLMPKKPPMTQPLLKPFAHMLARSQALSAMECQQ